MTPRGIPRKKNFLFENYFHILQIKNWQSEMRLNPPLGSSRVETSHLDGMVAWAQTRQINDFLKAINGLLQAYKRRAHGFTRIATIKTIIFLIAGKLDFKVLHFIYGLPLESKQRLFWHLMPQHCPYCHGLRQTVSFTGKA